MTLLFVFLPLLIALSRLSCPVPSFLRLYYTICFSLSRSCAFCFVDIHTGPIRNPLPVTPVSPLFTFALVYTLLLDSLDATLVRSLSTV